MAIHTTKFWIHYRTLIMIAAPLPLLRLARALRRWRRSRLANARIRAGLCADCGYDLRATPGRCPECGTQAPAPQRAAGSA